MTPGEADLNTAWWAAMAALCLVQVKCGCGMEPRFPYEHCENCAPEMTTMLALEKELERVTGL